MGGELVLINFPLVYLYQVNNLQLFSTSTKDDGYPIVFRFVMHVKYYLNASAKFVFADSVSK